MDNPVEEEFTACKRPERAVSLNRVPYETSPLPSAVRLKSDFDVDLLQHELVGLRDGGWAAQRAVADSGELTAPSESDWKCLVLRGPGGNPGRTDPGGPGRDGFAYTPWSRRAPYMTRILKSLPAELRSARLMSLAPGVRVPEHRDTPTGFAYGCVRLHIPVTTNPRAVLVIDGAGYCWQPGTLWYGDFSRPHSVANAGDSQRVHLVIDCAVTPDLLALFPASFRDAVSRSDVVFYRPEAALQPDELPGFRCQIPVPPSFLRLDEPVRDTDEADLRASVTEADGSLMLQVENGLAIGLVHVGGGEFRLQGWYEERGLRLDLSNGAKRVTFQTRRGSRFQRVTRPALTPPGPPLAIRD